MAGTVGDLTYTTYDYYGDYGDTATSHYGAQTFVAAGDHLQSLELIVDAYGAGPSAYHVLITTVKTLPGGQFQPGAVLKEVSLVEPYDDGGSLRTIKIDLNGLELDEGTTYAFIIDGFVTRDGTQDALEVAYNSNEYAGGLLAELLIGTGRATDFNADWNEGGGAYDFAFKAVFTDAGETIIGSKKSELIDGTHAPKGQSPASALDDMIYGNNGNDRISGGDGFDYLNGGKGNDKLNGDNDGDVLVGGKGKDKLIGGAGEDCFVFDFAVSKGSAKKNFDKIYDFNVAEDSIYLDPGKFSALAPGDLPATDTHITYQKNALFYDGVKFAQFKISPPASIDDIHIVVSA